MQNKIAQHEKKVVDIQHALKSSKGNLALKKSASCCSRSFAYKTGKTLIDISGLDKIIEINVKEKYIVVEPLVTMEQIVRATLKFKLVIPVVPEFRQMTIGGAISGLGGESTSFRHGFIDEGVLEYEVILADGTIQTITKYNEHQELFFAIPGSFGSLAIVTKIKLRLVDASKYVRVHYQRVNSIEKVCAHFREANAKPLEISFIECVALSTNDFRIATGYKTDSISLKNHLQNRVSLKYFFSRWYLDHLQKKSARDGAIDFMRYEDYLFRWDRGAFWLGLVLLELIGHYKHSYLNRLVFGKMLRCDNLFNILSRIPLHGREQALLMQDLIVPEKVTKNFFEFLNQKIGIYPIWMIPIKPPRQQKIFSLPHDKDGVYVDFGVWGFQRNSNALSVNREIEIFLQQHHGRKWLWNQSYLNPDEFWSIYDFNQYHTLRKKYHAEGRLVCIYEKVTEYYQSILKDYARS